MTILTTDIEHTVSVGIITPLLRNDYATALVLQTAGIFIRLYNKRNLVKKEPQWVMDLLKVNEYKYKDREYQRDDLGN